MFYIVQYACLLNGRSVTTIDDTQGVLASFAAYMVLFYIVQVVYKTCSSKRFLETESF